MTSRHKPNAIAESGRPLVFALDTRSTGAPVPPRPRLGDAVRTVATSLAGFQKEAFVSSAKTGATWRMVSDEGSNLRGHDAAPPPLGFFSVGLVASYLTEISALADQRAIALRDLHVQADSYYPMTGSHPRKTMAGGALPVEVNVAVDAPLDDQALTRFVIDAISAAPVNGLLRQAHESLFRLSANGREIDPAQRPRPAQPLIQPAQTQPIPVIPDQPIVAPLGPSPDLAQAGSRATGAYSVQEANGTLVHVGASGRVRGDGLKEIRQQLFAPHGTEWLYLSDESAARRAPDATSYLAAGIGFCFMTQFGISIDVHKHDVASYQIVQDLHVSPGGASGKTGTAGTAAPPETHIHFQGAVDDATAQELLVLAERSCFLHSLCREPLKTKLSVRGPRQRERTA